MSELESQNVEDINISFNQDIDSYVINVSYRRTDSEGNVDIISIRDLPITINPYPNVNSNLSYRGGCETAVNLGFGRLYFYPGITSYETRRIHTATKEMTIEEIGEELGYKVKIVDNKKADRLPCKFCMGCKFIDMSSNNEPCVSCRNLSNFVNKEEKEND